MVSSRRALIVAIILLVAMGCQRRVAGPPSGEYAPGRQDVLDVDAFIPRMPAFRKQVAAALGLDPFPERTPLDLKSFGVLDSPDFTLEKLEFTSRPGFPVTAHLYLPKKRQERVPAVLNVHGHWPGAKSSEQVRMRCAQFARMGLVAMAIDAYGSPGPGNERGDLGGHYPNDALTDGISGYLFTTGVSIAGICTWDAIRAIDYLVARPEVDPARIATCGASYGATQALLAAIVDDRVAAVAAVCYGSSFTEHPQNISAELVAGIAHDTTRHELLSLPAPRPLLLLQHYADQPRIRDAVRRTYAALGASDRFVYEQIDGPHDFERPKREAVYRWVSRVFLGKDKPVAENPNYPFATDALFCHPDHRVGPEALSVEDMFREVERNVGRNVPAPQSASAWKPARDAYVAALRLGIKYKPEDSGPGLDVPAIVVDAPESLSPASPDLQFLFREGFGYVVVRGRHGEGGTLRIVPRSFDLDAFREWATREHRAGRSVCAVRLDGYERLFQASRNEWDAKGRDAAQIRYAMNAIGMMAGQPFLYRKVLILRRAVEAMVVDNDIDPGMIQLEAEGDDANVVLVGAVVEPALAGRLVLRDPLLSYLRRDEHYPPLAAAVAGILRYVDVGDLVALLAPRPVTIEGGHLADGSRPRPGGADDPLAKANRTYRAVGAARALTIRP